MKEKQINPAPANRSAAAIEGRNTEEQGLEDISAELIETESSAKAKTPSGKSGTRKRKTSPQETGSPRDGDLKDGYSEMSGMPEERGADDRTIEDLFTELDGIIGKLEDGEISLEDSFQYYEAGMKLVRSCSGKIDKVEKQIQVLNESAVEE